MTSSKAEGSTRCFCNLPACISTGYMCKSATGGCFSDLNHYSTPQSVYHGRHGCFELLVDKDEKDWCQRYPNGNPPAIRRKNAYPRSLLYCCSHDMCNHADDPQTKDLINDTTLGDIFNDENRVIESQWDGGYNNADVWFKAATIAVPICGAVILFVLIALAIRLLRTESCQNTDYKLGCTYSSPHDKNNCEKHHEHYHTSQRLLFKEPLPQHNAIYTSHIADIHRHSRSPIIIQKDVNVRNAKMNYFNPSDYNLLPQNPQIFEIHKSFKSNNTQDKNVNLVLDEGYSESREK